jgi:tRNA(adenine34) deaminase
MCAALEEAKLALADGCLPFGAVIVHGSEIIARNRSREKTLIDVTVHAELQAVSQACRALQTIDLGSCTIYATGEPCNMCASAIFQANVSRVVIAATRADLSKILRKRKIDIFELAKDRKYEPTIETGLFKAEALKLFSEVKR